jgi:hypothetical protein
MIELHAQYPDWKDAWKVMAKKYYIDEPDMTKTIWNANLNGACAILPCFMVKVISREPLIFHVQWVLMLIIRQLLLPG